MNALYTRDFTAEEPQDSPDSPTTLEDIIEEERTRLLTAGTVLGCASVAIENDRSADRHAFYYADVIEVARKMILQTTDRLDSVCLEAFYAATTEGTPRSFSNQGGCGTWNDHRDLWSSAAFVDYQHWNCPLRRYF